MLEPAPEIRELTGDDLAEIVAENPHQRFELVEGVLIEMPSTGIEHGECENLVAFYLTLYNREKSGAKC